MDDVAGRDRRHELVSERAERVECVSSQGQHQLGVFFVECSVLNDTLHGVPIPTLDNDAIALSLHGTGVWGEHPADAGHQCLAQDARPKSRLLIRDLAASRLELLLDLA